MAINFIYTPSGFGIFNTHLKLDLWLSLDHHCTPGKRGPASVAAHDSREGVGRSLIRKILSSLDAGGSSPILLAIASFNFEHPSYLQVSDPGSSLTTLLLPDSRVANRARHRRESGQDGKRTQKSSLLANQKKIAIPLQILQCLASSNRRLCGVTGQTTWEWPLNTLGYHGLWQR